MLRGTGEIAEWIAWIALALCAYTCLGYPLLLAVVSKLFTKPHEQDSSTEPTVSLLIPAHNEADVIREKIKNSLDLDYPRKRLQIRVVSDGSDDGTNDIVRHYESEGIELQQIDPRGGKPSAVNQAVPYAWGEILVLCDANTMFTPDAVRQLVRHFADAHVGAVTGDVRLRSEEVAHGEGEGLFWRLERFIQHCESTLWTSIGVDGGMYALQKDLYMSNQPNTLIDDFVIAMNVARAGYRVIYDPEAVATEDAVADPAQEFRRRVRTTAGGFQSLFGGRGRPKWIQPRLWFMYLSHKGLRWCSPFLLIALLASTLIAVATVSRTEPLWFAYAGLLGAQVGGYVLGLLTAAVGANHVPRILTVPYYFCLVNAAALVGFFKWLLNLQKVTWVQADRRPSAVVRPEQDEVA